MIHAHLLAIFLIVCYDVIKVLVLFFSWHRLSGHQIRVVLCNTLSNTVEYVSKFKHPGGVDNHQNVYLFRCRCTQMIPDATDNTMLY